MKKHILCLLVALILLMLPGLALEAGAAEIIDSGSCGDDLTWTLDSKGTLTISGTGDMADYASASDVPWYASRASVKAVVIKDNITTIGDRAFYNCSALTDITIGSDVQTVGMFAFQGCSALEEIVLPAAVTELKDSAFRACAALEAVTFGGNAPALGSYVFTNGASDMTVYYYEGSTGFDSDPWYDYYQETMHVGQWVVDTEPGCTTDGSKHIDCAYCETTITETIPSTHNYVDGVCSVCQKIQLLDSGSCGYDLTWELDVRGTLTITGTGSMLGYYSFSNAPWHAHRERIISVVMEEGVTTIGSSAFYDCSSLKSVTIPDSVTDIGNSAFIYCDSLESISIPDSVITIGEEVFVYCTSLESVYIGDGITTISDSVFAGCDSLKSVTIPEGVTTIDEDAFYICSSLKSVTIPDSVTEIGEDAFYGCISLKSVTIPDSVTEIGSYAFYNCNSLTTVHYAGTEAQRVNIEMGPWNDELEYAVWHYECDGESCPNPFSDVAVDAYYAKPVLWAVNNGITNGLSENTFGPEATCTRGQIVTFLWRANGSPEPETYDNPFWDVTWDDYFYNAVLWAVENGITSGMGDGTFAPDAGCTRGQVATFLWRACGQPAPSGSSSFTDVAPGAYYYDAVLWAVEKGITNGMGDGTFAPDAPCTRGQIVTFLYRAMA